MSGANRGRSPRGGSTRRPPKPLPPKGTDARRLAAEALVRIDTEGAYANLVVPAVLERSHLETRDRNFVTELVYGTTRQRRSCDWLIDRFLLTDLDPTARAFLRLGAYQLVFLQTPAHAAVSATVEAAPKKIRGLVNAVLRKVAAADRTWPDEATRLSYPDWIIDRLTADLGAVDATAALEAMNEAASATVRDDGYMQDLGSQWVADAVGARAGERVLDLCAAPGGKATRMAGSGATVVAADRRPGRVGLIAANTAALGLQARAGAAGPGDAVDDAPTSGVVLPLAADGLDPPFPPSSFDRVLIDAPCSGLGTLRRRADARWRIEAADTDTLAELQRALIEAALALVRPGGHLVYSVCTLAAAETMAIDAALAEGHPELVALPPPATPWAPAGRGAFLLPQAAGTDGMYLLQLRRPG
jgi:16S rRNA (cytosine967-C5)-methyltransferase